MAPGIGAVWRDSLPVVLVAVIGCAGPELFVTLARALLDPSVQPYRLAACRLVTAALPLMLLPGADALRSLGALCSGTALKELLRAAPAAIMLVGAWTQAAVAQLALQDRRAWAAPEQRWHGTAPVLVTCAFALVLGTLVYRLLIDVGRDAASGLLAGLPFEPGRLAVCGVDPEGLERMLRTLIRSVTASEVHAPLLDSLTRVRLTPAQAACVGRGYAGLPPSGCGYAAVGAPTSAWLTGLGGCALLCAVELLLRFRVVAALSCGGVVKPLAFGARLALTHLWTVTRHITCLALGLYLANGLLVTLPVTLAKEMLVPSLVEVSGNNAVGPLLTFAIDAGAGLVSALFIAFSTVYDARLYTTLADPTTARRRAWWEDWARLTVPFTPPPRPSRRPQAVPEPASQEADWLQGHRAVGTPGG